MGRDDREGGGGVGNSLLGYHCDTVGAGLGDGVIKADDDALETRTAYPFGMFAFGSKAEGHESDRRDFTGHETVGVTDDPGSRYQSVLDAGARTYIPGLGIFASPDPLADLAPEWSPYRYGFNDPVNYVDPDGLFETKADAERHAEDNDIKTGGLFGAFRANKIREQSDGSYAIENRREHTSTADEGGELGVMTAALVTPNDVMGVATTEGGNMEMTLRSGETQESEPTAGTVDVGGRGGGSKIAISVVKKALKEIYKELGTKGPLPKGPTGKYGSTTRGDKVRGYRVDKVGHPKSSNPNEKGPHINWWDYTKGKLKSGRGRKGAERID